MKSIISVNKKFMDYSPIDLVNLIKENSKYIDGFEICINCHDLAEVQYLKDLAECCKMNNYHFQVHGDSTLSIDEQIDFIKLLENISDFLGYKINVVLHSIKADTNLESVELTSQYMADVTEKTDNSKITISLENLNDIFEEDRLDINDIVPIVANNENLFLTYDIGHEIVDYYDVGKVNEHIIPLISNVHIHSTNYDRYNGGFDHKPIFKGDEKWNSIMKGIYFLKSNDYDQSIVFEYDLFVCPGDTILEKIISYCESIDYVSERFK